jgi:phospholipid/cholesterol/gamma-HCH transport system substrate-binding protein
VSERSIEVKVGVLILVALGILAALILVMSGISFERTYPLYVDFDNPGGLQSGGPVRMAGVRVGTVKEIRFMGGVIDPKTQRRTVVRVELSIYAKVKSSVHDDALFYVTTQGVLGEQFLAIDPGSPDHPILPEGATVKGIDPPRLDLFLAKAYELLDTAVTGLRNNRELISDIAHSTATLLKGLSTIVTEHKERIDRIVTNLEELSAEASGLARDTRARVNDPRVTRTIENIDRISSAVQRDSGPLLKDAREGMANLNRASALLGDPKEQERYRRALQDLAELLGRANVAAADAQAVVAKIKKGEGTVGALVMDEEIYDDIQEMVRDLKHNPWKFLWRE